MNAATAAELVPAAAAGATVLLFGAWGRDRSVPSARPVSPPHRPAWRATPQLMRHPARLPVAAALVLLPVLGWIGPILAAAVALVTRTSRPHLTARRRRRLAHRALPDAVERFVLLVHAGLTPPLAVRAAGHAVPVALRPAFDSVVHRLDRGAPLADALGALPAELGPHAAPLADAIAAAERYGLPLEPMLDQLARDARQERRRLDEADARRLPVRLAFPLVTCTLPSFVLVAIAPAVIAALSSLGTSW